MSDIVMPRGSSLSFILKLKDSLGASYSLSSGDKLIFGIKHFANHKSYLVSKTKTLSDYDSTLGGYRFVIAPEDTADFAFDTYVFDIGCQKSTGEFYQVIPTSNLIISSAITKKST